MNEHERCWATSWPFTVNDTRCIKDAGHKDRHRDGNGHEWGGDDVADSLLT